MGECAEHQEDVPRNYCARNPNWEGTFVHQCPDHTANQDLVAKGIEVGAQNGLLALLLGYIAIQPVTDLQAIKHLSGSGRKEGMLQVAALGVTESQSLGLCCGPAPTLYFILRNHNATQCLSSVFDGCSAVNHGFV